MEFNLDFIYKGIPLVLVIIGLSKIFVSVGFNKKFVPITNIILGLLGGIFYLHPSDIKMGILVGLALGLSTTGTYSSAKNIIEGIKE